MTIDAMTQSKHLPVRTAKASALTLAMLLMQSNIVIAADDINSNLQVINNIANASYNVNNQTGVVISSTSNQVQVKASALPEYGISLSQQPLLTVMPNTTVNWVNVLSNTSYSDQNIELKLTVSPKLSNLRLYRDLNKNGIIDRNDSEITLNKLTAQIRLDQGESIQLIVQALSDPNGKSGDTADIKLGAVVLEDTSIASASVTDALIIVEPEIKFTHPFIDPDFDETKPKSSSQVDEKVYVQASYAQCNYQANQPDQVWATITSPATGDVYSLKATETGNNTGKYRLDAPTENNANAILNDKIVQTLQGDTLQVTLDACIKEDGTREEITDDISSTIAIVNQNPNLLVTKESEVKSAELGDYVNYTINVTNSGESTAYDVQLKDALPRGFDYVEGSVRVTPTNAIDISQPQTAEFRVQGRYQVLGLGDLAVNESKAITYRVLVGASALGGDGINRAIATAKNEQGKDLLSREAQWQIDVERGVMNTDGIIVGKVYHDINRDGIQQKEEGELGVAGVRIYMENGNFVVTDPEGKYNFYGISAKTHVLKVDRTTIPNATELVIQSNRNTGDAGSRFVDLKYGELHRADFGIVGGMGDSMERLNTELVARSKSISAKNNALEQAIKSELDLEPIYNRDYKDNVDASGCKSNDALDQGIQCDSAIVNNMVSSANRIDMTITKVAQPQPRVLEEYLKEVATNEVAFINLNEGQQLSTYKQMVQVKAPLGSTFTLYANGKAVSEQQIGKTAEQEKQSVTAFDYYAVDLKRGSNTLRGVATDVNGNVISEQTIKVMTPDSLQAIDYRTQDQLVPADGVSDYQVVISLKDRDGSPYIASTPITIDTNIGRINLKDSSKDKAGTQVTVSGGELLIPVTAPSVPGKGELIIDTGSSKQVIPLQFTAQLRPLIAVGIIEGAISLKDFDGSQITDAQGAFEKELHEYAGNDDYAASGRAAMFLKGKVRGDYLLTLSYDSDKKGERLFRDIEPGEYYPVYGDSSAKGFDAQSTSKLYVRVDKGRSFAMYGDLKTQIDNDEGIKLGQYNRTLTGVKAQYEDDNTRVTAFVAETSTSQRVNETRGLGISGPYPLAENFDAVLENSEIVEVITRDANNPGLIISREILTRFADYEIDPISRSLFLKSPIASQDINGNPIYLRVTVEVDEGGEKYWVGGVALKQQLNKKVAVGGSYTNSDDPLNKEQLASVNTVIKMNDKLKLVAEYAMNKAEFIDKDLLVTDPDFKNPNYQPSNQINTKRLNDNKTDGNALRVELDYDDKKNTRAKAYYNDTDEGFVTGASPQTAGRQESGFEVAHLINDKKTTLKLEGVRTKDLTTEASRQGVLASIEQRLSTNIVGEIGVRYYKQDATAASRSIQAATDVVDVTDDTIFNDDIINQSALSGVNNADKDIEGTTARARITARLPKLNNSLVFAEYEQDIDNSERNATSIGGETPLGGLGRLYARHDLINSLSGSYGLDDTEERQRTVVGFDANYMKDGKVYSEYRMRDAISAREAEAAIGLKNKWYVQQGLTINTLFERVESLEGDTENTATAAGIGVEYLAKEDYKASGRFEKRWGETSNTLLGSAGIAYRYTDEVTLLAKDIYSRVDYTDGDRTINRFQLGAAFRDYDSNQLDALAKLEYRLDDNNTGDDAYQKDTVIWSLSGNYHPTRPLTLSGRYAGKHTQFDADNISSDNTAHALYGRSLYDISERWDVGLQAGTYWNKQADDMSYMLGAEVGYSPMTNLWLSLGYNFMGFEDDDIAYEDTTQQGAYFRLRFKFDEDLFKAKDASKNPRLNDNSNF